MKCDQVMENIMPFHDGELPEGAARDIRAHIAGCRDCRATLRVLEEADRAAGIDLPDEAYFDGLTARVMAAVRQERAEAEERSGGYWWRRFTRLPVLRLAPAVSLALVVVVAIGVWYRAGGMRPPPPEMSREAAPAVRTPAPPPVGRPDGPGPPTKEPSPGNGYENNARPGVDAAERTKAATVPASESPEVPVQPIGAAVNQERMTPVSTGAGKPELAADAGDITGRTDGAREEPVRPEPIYLEDRDDGRAQNGADPAVAEEAAVRQAVHKEPPLVTGEEAREGAGAPSPVTAPPERSAVESYRERSLVPSAEPTPGPVPTLVTGSRKAFPAAPERDLSSVLTVEEEAPRTPSDPTEEETKAAVLPTPEFGAGREVTSAVVVDDAVLPPEVASVLDRFFGRGNYVIMYNQDINGDGLSEVVAVQPLQSGRERSFAYDPATQAPLGEAQQFSRGLVVQEIDGTIREQLLIDQHGIEDRLQNTLPPGSPDVVYTLRRDALGDPRNLVLNTIPVSGTASTDRLIRWDESQGAYVLEAY